MKQKKNLYIFMILLLFLSFIGIGFNIKNYNEKIKLKNKYINNTEIIKKEIDRNQTELKQIEDKYNTLLEEENEKIEVYKSWKEKNEEIKEYLK